MNAWPAYASKCSYNCCTASAAAASSARISLVVDTAHAAVSILICLSLIGLGLMLI